MTIVPAFASIRTECVGCTRTPPVTRSGAWSKLTTATSYHGTPRIARAWQKIDALWHS